MRKIIIIILLLLIIQNFSGAYEVRTDAEDFWIQTKPWENILSTSMIIDSSLHASGLKNERFKLYRDKYSRLLETFRNDLDQSYKNLSDYNKGEFILNWAHDNILKNYIEEQTLMDVLIDTGNYNCVSSAVFYLILTKEAGLMVKSVETSDHAFCTVKTEEGWVDVETTTSHGFNPGIKKEFQKAFNQTGYTYVPPGNYRNRNTISEKETIALILQNRMSGLQKYELHDQAVGLAIDRWTLADTETNYKDMNDSFRNWSAVLNNKGNYTEAYYFLHNVSSKYNLINNNRDLLYDLAYNQIISLTNNGNFDIANEFLAESKLVLINTDQIKLENLVTRSFLSDFVKKNNYKESLPLIRDAYESNSITRSEWQNWITVLHQNKALEISKSTDWWEAWQFLKNLPTDEKNLPGIKKSTNLAHDNWSFDIHNKFADLFNSQNFEEAEQILLKALQIDPGNKYLTQDLNNLKNLIF